MSISIFESISYAFVLKILKGLDIPVSEFNSDTVEKIKDVLIQPQSKEAIKQLVESYSKISEDIIKETTEKIFIVWQQTLKRSGASLTRLLVDIIPVVGSVVLGVDSAAGVVSHTAEGVDTMIAIIGNALNEIFSKIKLNPNDVEVPYKLQGGFLVRSKSKTLKRKQNGGSRVKNVHFIQRGK